MYSNPSKAISLKICMYFALEPQRGDIMIYVKKKGSQRGSILYLANEY